MDHMKIDRTNRCNKTQLSKQAQKCLLQELDNGWEANRMRTRLSNACSPQRPGFRHLGRWLFGSYNLSHCIDFSFDG